MTVFMFPGQGSQQAKMGEELFDKVPEFYRHEQEIDALLGYSLRELCLDEDTTRLNQTQFTQPALFVINALHYYQYIADNDVAPTYVAGHSLGEYNALLAGGVFDLMTGLQLVQKRGELMSKAKNGGMAAVIGLDYKVIEAQFKQHNLDGIDIANYNAPTQTVVSGPVEEINRAQAIIEQAGARAFIPLAVSAAFHSRYMQQAATEFAAFLAPIQFNRFAIPTMANVTGRPYPLDAEPADIKAQLVKQITHPVKWTECIRYLLAKDISEFKEIGPGNVLTRLAFQVKKEAEPLVLPAPVVASAQAPKQISLDSLGCTDFKADYGLKYAYMAGAMYKGIASKEMVVALGKAGLMGFLGTGGLSHNKVEQTIIEIKNELGDNASYGMNLLNDLARPEYEAAMVDLYFKHGVKHIEAAAYMQVTPGLVRFRLKGVYRNDAGFIVTPHHVMAKISRPEVATAFMQPAPDAILEQLLAAGQLTADEVALGRQIPVAGDICVEADSGGHTDQGSAYALMPAMMVLRSEMMQQYDYHQNTGKNIRIGAAGGIGTPEAAAAAFMLGADFIVTGSINQCTPEAGTSDAVKNLLQGINVQDTAYAPAGDMFELGARVQVLKRGLFFPARANKLYELYQRHNSLDEIDQKTRQQIQDKYFKRSFADVWQETRDYYLNSKPAEVDKAERQPKHKMLLIFKWYFIHSTRLAMAGSVNQKTDYQIHCGPALGAFNQWVKGTELEDWRERKVVTIGEKLMQGTADLLNQRFGQLAG